MIDRRLAWQRGTARWRLGGSVGVTGWARMDGGLLVPRVDGLDFYCVELSPMVTRLTTLQRPDWVDSKFWQDALVARDAWLEGR